jgi:hypothetical protein
MAFLHILLVGVKMWVTLFALALSSDQSQTQRLGRGRGEKRRFQLQRKLESLKLISEFLLRFPSQRMIKFNFSVVCKERKDASSSFISSSLIVIIACLQFTIFELLLNIH